jgi:hypothetical protein
MRAEYTDRVSALLGEVSANFWGHVVPRRQRDVSLQSLLYFNFSFFFLQRLLSSILFGGEHCAMMIYVGVKL